MATPRLSITELSAGQANAEVLVNTAFRVLEALSGGYVLDRDLTAPPGSPADGDVYIVATGATGDWAGQDDKLAIYASGWIFKDPKPGMTIWVGDEAPPGTPFIYNGTSWVQLATA